ncbi:glycoside hydrolase family 16 protein [Chiua virens]|nr:glycoside hydrolase family 16 protein [Chiua virens]KAG9313092.1 glycoside hydrolase family 16 protein [Chiua virens]
MYARFLCLLAVLPFGTSVGAWGAGAQHKIVKRYTLQKKYQANDFFTDWTFFTGNDPTGGNVNYVSMDDAQSQGLAYVDSSDNTLVLAVDSTSDVSAGGNRNSVRITSNDDYTGGLFILDAVAMPVGCGTWPSFWTNGPNWPEGGEIDIIEGVNDQANNQMTLHSGTSNACTIDSSNKGSGQVLNKNCYSNQTSDSGCSIKDPSTSSFGYGFNAANGGVFALQWDASTGMSMWHFSRSSIPSDISGGSPTPSNWGEATGFWSASTCNISANFYSHAIIIDTTICGNWAGSEYSQSGCSGTCSQMVSNATNFANAKWKVNYVAVYQ